MRDRTRSAQPVFVSIASILGIVLLCSPGLLASSVTYTFTGTVISVDPSLSGMFDTSMTLSGLFTYDSSTPGVLYGTDAIGFVSDYQGALTNFVMTVGSYTAAPPFGTDVSSGMGVLTNWHFENSGFNVVSRLTGTPINGFNPIGGLFFYTGDSVFSSTQLTDVGDLTGWTTQHPGAFWYLAFDCCGGSRVFGMLTSLIRQPGPLVIQITSPTTTSYVINQPVASSYSCSDSAAAVTSCAGPVPNGANFDTASGGTKNFKVNAADAAGNTWSATVTYQVGYGVCLLFDPTKVVNGGNTIPIKLYLCDATSADLSSSSVVVHAVQITQVSNNITGAVQDSGNANPDNDFRYDPTLGPTGGYIFNLSTKGLTTGTYQLKFTASGDPVPHAVNFQVK